MYLFLKFSEGAGTMPLEPTRLGHLLLYKFSPHVHTTLKSLAMPLVRLAHSPLIPPPTPRFPGVQFSSLRTILPPCSTI